MRASSIRQALPVLLPVGIALLALTTAALPIRWSSSTSQEPVSGPRAFTNDIYCPHLPPDMSEKLQPVLNKIARMSPQQKARVAANLKKHNEPPRKPTTWIGKFWERILKFFGRRRRPPAADIWDAAKSIGGKTVPPVVTGVSLGLFSGWVLCASARIGEIIRAVVLH